MSPLPGKRVFGHAAAKFSVLDGLKVDALLRVAHLERIRAQHVPLRRKPVLPQEERQLIGQGRVPTQLSVIVAQVADHREVLGHIRRQLLLSVQVVQPDQHFDHLQEPQLLSIVSDVHQRLTQRGPQQHRHGRRRAQTRGQHRVAERSRRGQRQQRPSNLELRKVPRYVLVDQSKRLCTDARSMEASQDLPELRGPVGDRLPVPECAELADVVLQEKKEEAPDGIRPPRQ
mmetsp:Transcript_23629/g.60100  ORF Transcript_23629/g.60100 Transcript_23629/m.60100 type:complete len:230 (+) Transcript_23629:208-897(+)